MPKKILMSIFLCSLLMLPVALFAENVLTANKINESGFGSVNNPSSTIFKHHGILFALTTNASGLELWRWAKSQDQWIQISDVDLVADPNNISIGAITVFEGRIYVAFNNSVTGAEVWAASLGSGQRNIMKKNHEKNKKYNWQQVNADGFGKTANTIINNFFKYQDVLYASSLNNSQTPLAEIWSTGDGSTWTQMGETGLGNNIAEITAARTYKVSEQVYYVIGTLDGKLYISTDSLTWTLAKEFNDAITSLAVFQKSLLAAVENTTEGAELYATNDLIIFTEAADKGFGNANNTAVNFRKDKKSGNLIALANNEQEGGELWYTAVLENDAWQNLFITGVDNVNNIAFHDYIWYKGNQYLSTINAINGTEIYQIQQ